MDIIVIKKGSLLGLNLKMSIYGSKGQKIVKAQAVHVLIHDSNLLFPPCSYPVSETSLMGKQLKFGSTSGSN